MLEDKTKVHVAGVPLLSVADCRLLGSVVVRSGCDDVERQKTQLVLFLFARERSGSLACRVAPHLRLVWRRGPLAPLVVVVGEGKVNLVYDRCSRCSCHGQSLQSFVVDLMMKQIDLQCNAGSYGTGRRLRLLTWGLHQDL